ncbi:MAG TPA: hypothetical protein DCE56_25860 [Cyanobacteria bacterium UBA8553]|nr:hypothetical protein [Cyanobacteria bacterium UBA8553]HAJ62342.1 hypothetical protein [Cyanobacteria bacterium UBA8543]
MDREAFFGATLTPREITISLRRPYQSTPIQKWTFENEQIIKIGRASDNHVILHSSVVSRYHVEIQHMATHWKLINLGNNGTYLNDQSIIEVPVVDGIIICLARSGPQLQINLGSTAQKSTLKTVRKQHSVTEENNNKERDTFIQKPTL